MALISGKDCNFTQVPEVHAARVSLTPPHLSVDYGLLFPDGRMLWSWLSVEDVKSSLFYLQEPRVCIVERHWIASLTIVDVDRATM